MCCGHIDILGHKDRYSKIFRLIYFSHNGLYVL